MGFLFGCLVAGVQQSRLGVAVLARGLAAEAVDGPIAGSGDDPASRAGWRPARRPALDGRGEGVLDRLLGDVDVAEDTDQDRHGSPVLLPKYPLDVGAGEGGHAPDQPSRKTWWNGRTSIGSVVARASLRPQSSAASRSGALMIEKPAMYSLLSA